MIHQRLVLVLTLLAGLAIVASDAIAQPQPARPVVALDVFLEQRVVEELAAEGTILSRLGVALDVEMVGDRLLVSLVDPATRRSMASTKLDKVPADREAAVASVTQVVSNLVAQLGGGSASATAVKAVLEDDRRDRREREEAELAYKREAITFSDLYVATTNGTSTNVSRTMLPYRGDRRLTPVEFFHAVDRPDLASSFSRRRSLGFGGIVASALLMTAGTIVLIGPGLPERDYGLDCFTAPNRPMCEAEAEARTERNERSAANYRLLSYGLFGASLVAGGIGFYYLYRASPISENEAHDLADDHNAKLRRKYQLPGARAHRRVRPSAVALSPYVAPSGGGLSLSGRF